MVAEVRTEAGSVSPGQSPHPPCYPACQEDAREAGTPATKQGHTAPLAVTGCEVCAGLNSTRNAFVNTQSISVCSPAAIWA